jgi:hypothetical protein
MPHPKNRLKLTGDTHLPDVGPDMNLGDDERSTSWCSRRRAAFMRTATCRWSLRGHAGCGGGTAAGHAPQPHGIVGKLERKVERQTARTPLAGDRRRPVCRLDGSRMLRR